jgi:hypothetical protein
LQTDAVKLAPMTWLLRLLSILAAAITSLFVARDVLNFGINLADGYVDYRRRCHRRCMESPARILSYASQSATNLQRKPLTDHNRDPRSGSCFGGTIDQPW